MMAHITVLDIMVLDLVVEENLLIVIHDLKALPIVLAIDGNLEEILERCKDLPLFKIKRSKINNDKIFNYFKVANSFEEFKSIVTELENWLGLKIDLAAVFDNSHLFGKSPVGAMITFSHNGFEK